MAVNLHGYRRSTGDMDIFVNPTKENHKLISKVHSDFGMHMGEMEDVESFLNINKFDVFTFGVSPVQIDIMTACKGLAFSDAFDNAVKMKVDKDIEVRVVDYRELIIAKKASNRLRDQADLEELKRIKKDK